MTRKSEALSRMAVAAAGILAVFLCAGQALAQAGTEGPTFETITVTGDRPVARAMDEIERRYGVLIDYMDAPYVAPQDLQLYRSYHGKPLAPPIQGPKTWTLSAHYWQVPGTPESVAPIYRCKVAAGGCAEVATKPQEGIEALIQEVLHQFAEQGGQIFTVRKLEMPYGARWEVYPTYARNKSGEMVAQPDLLSTRISIPKARRWPGEMFNLIAQQLTQGSGTKFSVGLIPGVTLLGGVPDPPGELGAEDVSARRVIAGLAGQSAALRVRYGIWDPASGYGYYINIVPLPYREPVRPPTPKPAPAKFLRMRPVAPGAYWLGRTRTPEGIQEIQQGLAKLGYLRTPPTTRWDANAIAALKRFQQARGLPQQTGKFDELTAAILSPSLPPVPTVPVYLRAEPAMSPELGMWLNSTPDGRKEIQQALATAGFYNGPVNGIVDVPTRDALKAFQTANGLEPTGGLDWDTAVKLSPYLPKSK